MFIDNEDVTDQLSNLLTNVNYISYFYDLIDMMISLMNNDAINAMNDVTIILEKSLFVSQLLTMSVAIPSENNNYHNNNYFDFYSIRVNNRSINQSLNNDNITININYQDTNIGRDDFANYKESLNCVDIILITLDDNNTYRVSPRTSINIISNQTYHNHDNNQLYPLNHNVSILYNKIDNTNDIIDSLLNIKLLPLK